MKTSTLSFLLGLSLTNLATARTDLSGCVSSEIVVDYYASYLWYVPGTGEICSFLDCGGGRAPPKTNQPGCPLYKGTATVTPSYIEGWGPNGKQAASTTTAAATTASVEATSTSAVSFETSTESSQGSSSDSSSTSSESASGTQTSGSLITAAPTTSPAVSMTTTTSPVSSAANSTSAASSTPTGNAANTPASNVGVMAILAAAVGAMVL